MTPEAFLENFGAVANAPGGVPRLREMILQLAVMGKLVEQNPEDEPASELLAKIEELRQNIVSSKKQHTLQKTLPKDIFHPVPQGWLWCRFDSIWELISGRDLPINQFNEVGSGIPYITGASNIENGNLVVNRWTEFPVVISKFGDLLISCKGTIGKTTFNTIGKSHIARQIMAIRSFTDYLDHRYLKIWLDGFVYVLISKSKSMIPGFSRNDLLAALYPLPPLAEQKRIVTKVDQLMVLCDRLEAQQEERSTLVKQSRISALKALADAQGGEALLTAWKRVQDHLSMLFDHPDDVEDLKKCILQNAVMGKLVPQNPDDEPASELLKKIAEEKEALIKKGEIKKQKPLPEIREDEKPFEIPEGWEWSRLDVLSKTITKGSSPKWQGVEYTENEDDVLFITSENVGEFTLILKKRKFVQKEFNSIEPRSILKNGDLLMNIVGASIGRVAIYDLDAIANINQAVCLIRLVENWLYTPYILFFLNSLFCIEYMFDKQVDNARANLSMGNISKFVIPIPPLAEQTRIVQKTQALLSLCDTLQKQLEKSQTIAEQLAQSVVESITGQTTEKQEKMKAPKTELVTKLKLVKKPGAKQHAPLSTILARHSDELPAKALWNTSGLSIDDFYRQLKTEMVNGWIEEPEKARVRIVEDQGTPT